MYNSVYYYGTAFIQCFVCAWNKAIPYGYGENKYMGVSAPRPNFAHPKMAAASRASPPKADHVTQHRPSLLPAHSHAPSPRLLAPDVSSRLCQ